MKIDWLLKLRRLLQTMAFCLAIAGLIYAFDQHAQYEVAVVYSICIGLCSWALIDFGALLFPSAHETGWPQGVSGVLLPIAGNALGFVLGVSLADTWLGRSSWAAVTERQLLLSVLMSGIIGTIITYYFYSRGKSDHLEKQVNVAKGMATEARLKLLETQLEPHMLFNTLANLRVLIGTDPQRAQDMLDRMVAYLRATLSASRTSNHPLAREFDRLRDYLELMSVRMGPRMHYVLDLPPDLADQSIPTLLLQPLVENSIKHGLEPKVEGGTITVRAMRDGQQLTLQVSDTGVGFDAAAGPSDGFGLAQVRERLTAAYAALGRVELTSTSGQGTTILLHLPLTAPKA
jgi:sensor histidine kinase YesM